MGIATLGIIGFGLGVAALMAAIQYLISRQRPKELAGDHGTLHLNDSMIAVGILIVWGVGCTGLFFHLAVTQSILALLIAFVSLVAVPVMATAFSSTYDISWDTHAITGPTTLRHPPFTPKRQEIAFDSIVAVGEDRWGNYFVEDDAGNRIRWNWFYNGYPELMHFIEDICPHLFPELEGEEASEKRDGEPMESGSGAEAAASGSAKRFWQGAVARGSAWGRALRPAKPGRAVATTAGDPSAGEEHSPSR